MKIQITSSAIMLLTTFSRLPKRSLCFSISSVKPASNTLLGTQQAFLTALHQAKQSETETRTYTQESLSGYKAPTVNWYPGHIAKAERTLSETLTSADVLVEVRDARIPKSTAHPKVREWTAGKPRIVVLTRVDMVPGTSIKSWSNALNKLGAGRWDGEVADGNIRHQANQAMKTRGLVGEDGQVEDVIYVDAKRGAGMPALLRAIGRSGAYVNEKRKKRGLRDRPLRVAILGYPNVGKSALINRILGRKRAKSANTPGITRALQWIRVKGDMDGTDETGKTRKTKSNKRINGDFELLDSPGIIPANMQNQEDAILLAVCNSIGNAAYDNQGVAAYLCERLKTLYEMKTEGLTAPQWRQKSIDRYNFDPLKPIVVPSLSDEQKTRIPTGEDMLFAVAENTCYGDPENAARKILQDFRNGRMGPACLQLAPKEQDDSIVDGEKKVAVLREVSVLGEGILRIGSGGVTEESEEERQKRAANAMRAAKERGLELPPMMTGGADDDDIAEATEDDVGKGLFDGW
jgi:ribosome biogenesis GTPase A